MRKKINVGVFTYDFYPFVGGQGRHVYELYKQNINHKLINMYIFSPCRNSLNGHISIFPNTKKSKFKNLAFSVKVNLSLRRIIKKYNLDIVHIHGGPGGLIILNKPNVPFVFTCHHTYWQQSRYVSGQSWKKILSILEKKSYNLADKIICVSSDTLMILSSIYHLKREKLTFIPNGLSKNLQATHKKDLINSKNILYLGRLDARKGIEFLIKSMVRVTSMDSKILLHVVGEGGLRRKLEYFVRTNRLSVKFHGHLTDNEISEIYRKTALQVVPSVFEGFGMSVIEAMANNTPVIATNVDGIKSILKHNLTGILVDSGNEEKLSNAIVSLANNDKLRNKLAENATKEIKKYNWNLIYQKTINLYESII